MTSSLDHARLDLAHIKRAAAAASPRPLPPPRSSAQPLIHARRSRAGGSPASSRTHPSPRVARMLARSRQARIASVGAASLSSTARLPPPKPSFWIRRFDERLLDGQDRAHKAASSGGSDTRTQPPLKQYNNSFKSQGPNAQGALNASSQLAQLDTLEPSSQHHPPQAQPTETADTRTTWFDLTHAIAHGHTTPSTLEQVKFCFARLNAMGASLHPAARSPFVEVLSLLRSTCLYTCSLPFARSHGIPVEMEGEEAVGGSTSGGEAVRQWDNDAGLVQMLHVDACEHLQRFKDAQAATFRELEEQTRERKAAEDKAAREVAFHTHTLQKTRRLIQDTRSLLVSRQQELKDTESRLEKRAEQLRSVKRGVGHSGAVFFDKPEDAVKLRLQVDDLRRQVASAQLAGSKARERAAAFKRQIKAVETETQQVRMQVEIVKQAVSSMHHVVDASVVRSFIESCKSSRARLTGRGLGRDVPAFLRWQGSVPQVFMSKRDVEMIIKEIWALKTVEESIEGVDHAAAAAKERKSSGKRRKRKSTARRRRRAKHRKERAHPRSPGDNDSLLADFFQRWVESKFDNPEMRAAFSYNFVGWVKRDQYDGDVELFSKILFGEISEDHFYDQIAMTAHLKKLFEELDVVDGHRDGFIVADIFFAALRLFFPVKSEKALQELFDVVYADNMTADSSHIELASILEETADGDQSEFMETVRDQYLQEIFEFPVIMRSHLVRAAPADLRLPAGQISALLQEVDPNLEEHHIDEYMVRGLKHPFTDSNELVDVGEFVANLQRKLLHRRGHYVTDLDVSKLAHLVPANYLDIITELKANNASAAPGSLSGWDDKSMRSHRSSIWG